jgi:hypothetical protein
MSDAVVMTFETDDGAMRALFARVGNPEPVLRDVGEYKRRQIVLSMPRMARNVPSAAGGPPARRTGLLSQRMTYAVEGPRLDVGTTDVRARLLHYGGTVRPVKAKALAIPVHRDAMGKRPGDFGNLVFVARKGSGRPPLLIRRVEKGPEGKKRLDREDVMFVLLKSVTIQARPFLLWRQPADEQYALKSLRRHVEGGGA